MRIFKPITISINPPNNSGLSRWVIALPNVAPSLVPMILKTDDTTPIIIIGSTNWDISSYPVQTKEIPTAIASILVATDSNSCVRR